MFEKHAHLSKQIRVLAGSAVPIGDIPEAARAVVQGAVACARRLWASPGGRTLKRLQYAPPTPQPRRMQGIHLDGYWEGAGRVLEGEPEQDAGEPLRWSGLGSGV